MSYNHNLPLDLNADIGEAFGDWTMGDDAAMIDVCTSVNVACGFHAGDAQTMNRVVTQAANARVRIGAHPGYRDLHGFGRRAMAYTPDDVYAEVMYQVGALRSFTHAAYTTVSYCKPHGALYNAIAGGGANAAAVIRALQDLGELPLMALAGSAIVDMAKAEGLAVIEEAFADRAYLSDGTLSPRSMPGSVLSDPEQAAAQAVAIATGQPIKTLDGGEIFISADSICVHGDKPAAVAMSRAVRAALEAL